MTKLRTFEFTYNLVRGLIPPEIGNLINLDTLMLNNNLFTSSLPPSLVKLTNLKLLFLSSNLLTGKVDFLCGMNLTLLDLNGNKFSGSFPMSSVLFHYLVFMDISVNHLTGPVPWREDIDGPLIIWYEIYSNYFTGTLPEITEAPHLRYYLVQENLLSGTLPAYFLASSTGLYYLAMSQNYLSGTIPESLGQFRQLNQLDMNGNMFHGSIPESFGHLRGLVVLDLDENLLSGPIPANITRLSFLQEVGYGLRVSMGAVLKQMAIWRNALKSDDPKKINLLRLSIYLHEVRKTVIVISLYAIVVLIPIYFVRDSGADSDLCKPDSDLSVLHISICVEYLSNVGEG
eukprot:gene6599-7104_t